MNQCIYKLKTIVITTMVLSLTYGCAKTQYVEHDNDEYVSINILNSLKADGLTNTKASKQTKKIYKHLQSDLKKSFLYGQQDATISGATWIYDNDRSDVKDVVNEHPAILGIDIGGVEMGQLNSWFEYSFDLLKKKAIEMHKMGGLVAISWHSYNFCTDGDSWDVSKKNTTQRIMLKNTPENDKFIKGLEKLSNYLKSFVDDNGNKIPLIFRPYHEHTSTSFWWALPHNKVDDFIRLWQYTYSFLVSNGNDNLIFTYSPNIDVNTSEDTYLNGYPGDMYVDALAVDCYHGSNTKKLNEITEIISKIAKQKNKIWGISELGTKNIVDVAYWTDYLLNGISSTEPKFVISWRNKSIDFNFGVYKNSKSEQNFKLFHKDSRTIFINQWDQIQRAN